MDKTDLSLLFSALGLLLALGLSVPSTVAAVAGFVIARFLPKLW